MISCVSGGVCICLDGAKCLLGCAVCRSCMACLACMACHTHVWDEASTHMHCAGDDHVHWHVWIEAVELGAAASWWWYCYPGRYRRRTDHDWSFSIWRRARLERLRLIRFCYCGPACMLAHMALHLVVSCWGLRTLCHCFRGACAHCATGHAARFEGSASWCLLTWATWAVACGTP